MGSAGMMKAKFDGSLREMACLGYGYDLCFVGSVDEEEAYFLAFAAGDFTRLPLPLSVLPGVSFALVVLVNTS